MTERDNNLQAFLAHASQLADVVEHRPKLAQDTSQYAREAVSFNNMVRAIAGALPQLLHTQPIRK